MAKVYAWVAAVALLGLGMLGAVRAEEPPPAPAVAATVEVDEDEPVPVPEPSEKAMEFYRGGMAIWAFNRAWAIALPAVILFSGLSARLRDVARRLGDFWIVIPVVTTATFLFSGVLGLKPDAGRRVGGHWLATTAVYIALFLVLTALIELPLDYYQGFVRLHAYDLSNQTHGKWLQDHVLELAVNVVISMLVACGAYAILRAAPRRWWLYVAVASVPFLLLGAFVKPIWIDPLFNHFGPMNDKALERSILDLAERAGITSGRVFEVDKSVDTKAVNAYVTGLFGTKRIVLWDTLLRRLEEREVLFVMAHEMGHYVLGHVVRSILLSFVVTLVGLYFVHRTARGLIDRFEGRFGFRELSDVASVPLILMLLQVAALFLGPVAMAYSRYQEHEADRYAIELTGMNRSGATAFAKLQAENLGNPRPGWVYRTFRASHPSIGERIDFCNAYRPSRAGGGSEGPAASGPPGG